MVQDHENYRFRCRASYRHTHNMYKKLTIDIKFSRTTHLCDLVILYWRHTQMRLWIPVEVQMSDLHPT